MRKKDSLVLLVVGLALFFLLSAPVLSFAAFSLSVTPYEGGSDLRFGKISPNVGEINREVTVRITSTIGKQYRLIQTLLDPLTTPEGNRLPERCLTVYGVRGSNKFGTINSEQKIPVTFGRDFIYTSNQQGSEDSFTLVYALAGPFEAAPGSYRGRISFTLEPIDSSQAASITVFNIYADIEVESSIEIKTAFGGSTIVLDPSREEKKSSDVSVSIKGGFGSQFRIAQILPQALISAEGNRLPDGAIKFSIKDARKGSGPGSPESLGVQQKVVYTSSARGEQDDFLITYSLGDLSGLKAGRYRGNIRYILDGSGYMKQGLIETLPLEVNNDRVFDLTITPETGGLLQFQDLKPKQPPRVSEVILDVKSNIGKPYQINQTLKTKFTNVSGKSIPTEYFTLKMDSKDTVGTLKYPAKTQVKEGDMVLFVSDAFGSSDKFKVTYELSIPDDIEGGNYSTQLVYTISEI